ncbi:hypothetical protein LINPERPRIM_LOCUS12604 [Linum perenne]
MPAPAPTPDEAAPLFSHDKLYGLHGKILLLVALGIFSIFFLVLLFVIPCLRRAAATDSSGELRSSSSPRGSPKAAASRE